MKTRILKLTGILAIIIIMVQCSGNDSVYTITKYERVGEVVKSTRFYTDSYVSEDGTIIFTSKDGLRLPIDGAYSVIVNK